MFVLGVGGCCEGWVLVALESGAFAGASQVATFEEVLGAAEEADAVGVNLPLGLLEDGERACDLLVREFVGTRRGNVVAAPPRPALLEPTYEEANAECLRRAGFAMGEALWGLKAKILEAERALRMQGAEDDEAPAGTRHPRRERARARFVQRGRGTGEPGALRRFARWIAPQPEPRRSELWRRRIFEVRPEASFRELAGSEFARIEKSSERSTRRRALLESAGIVLPRQPAIGRVSFDEVLDTAAGAWSAHRRATGRARRFPERDDGQSDGDWPLAIWV